MKHMELQGNCHRCQAPVFLNRTTDWYGNTVVTLNCWNGHYAWIDIQDIEEIAVESAVAGKENPVAHIGFFDMK